MVLPFSNCGINWDFHRSQMIEIKNLDFGAKKFTHSKNMLCMYGEQHPTGTNRTRNQCCVTGIDEWSKLASHATAFPNWGKSTAG